MRKSKGLLKWLPEIYFIVLGIFWVIDTYRYTNIGYSFHINYPILLLIAILFLQLFIKNNVIGLSISSLFGLYFFYLIFALLSDLRKVQTIDYYTIRYFGIGALFIAVTLIMSVLMFRKYYNRVLVVKV